MGQIDQKAIQLESDELQQNLIAALTKFKSFGFDSELLGDETAKDLHLQVETYIGFAIGKEHFLVQASCYCEVFVDTLISVVPNSPEILAGLSNIRGMLVPIYQLHSLLNESVPAKKTVICIGKGEATVGILIDYLPVSLSLIPQLKMDNSPFVHPQLRSLTTKSFQVDNTYWSLLDRSEFFKKLYELTTKQEKITYHQMACAKK